ncbi:MAG: carboxypeptidase-like regulatory domain-containing protein [candidate division Zixibacteria bacterium]|nr:carboxypeptidase-like regulatory domain-containing protein [candidate division Zixibacteria bacterium]
MFSISLGIHVPSQAGSGETLVNGSVINSQTGEEIPFASVRVAGSNRGTMANAEGRYRIFVREGDSELVFSAISFVSSELKFELAPDDEVLLNAYLTPVVLELSGTTVYADDLSEAQRIISRAISRKKEILKAIDNYAFKAYTKGFASYKQPSDTSFAVAFIAESQSNGYWRQPDDYKEIIVARKQGATLLPEWNTLGVYEIPNFNRDRIQWGPDKLPTPTATDALEIFNYSILDTLFIDSLAIFLLEFEPKEDKPRYFRGTVGIADSTYEVIEIDVSRSRQHENGKDSVSSSFQQRFERFEGKYWLPVNLNLEVLISSDTTMWKIEQIVGIQEYEINGELPTGLFDRFIVEVAEGADDIDSSDWASRQTIPLTARDKAGYKRTDFLKDSVLENNPTIRTAYNVYRANKGYKRFLKRYHLTSLTDIVHFNSVEGAYLGVGFQYRSWPIGPSFRFRQGRSTSAGRWNWSAELAYSFSKYYETNLSLMVSDGIAPIDYMSGREPHDATFKTLFFQTDPENYLEEEGWKALLSHRIFPKWKLSLSFADMNQKSINRASEFSFWGTAPHYKENPRVDFGTLREWGASLKFDTRDYIRNGRDVYPGFGWSDTQLELEYQQADSASVGGDFKFKRYMAKLDLRARNSLGMTRLKVIAGASSGSPPSQRYFRVAPDYGHRSTTTRLKTLGDNEFFGDRFLFAGIENEFRLNPFELSQIPVIKNFKGRLLVHGAIAWTDYYTGLPDQIQSYPELRNWYSEIGFGVSRFLPLGDLRFTWQLSAYDTNDFFISWGL